MKRQDGIQGDQGGWSPERCESREEGVQCFSEEDVQ